MYKVNTIFFFLLFSVVVFSQNYAVIGSVRDSVSNEALIGANVVLISLKDSSVAGGMATDNGGNFSVQIKYPGNYSLKISFIGYKPFVKELTLTRPYQNLGTILLQSTNVRTDAVLITGHVEPVVQKGDTTEYNANAFKVNKDANADEMVQKIPGVTIQDGTVKAQGEEVKSVLVDGKPFFGDDPNATLKNIPAEIIEKIQVFDKQSEQAQFTGFDDGTADKTINIITRTRVRQGTFGKVLGAYGDDQKYMGSTNINDFSGDRRVSVLGQINNINEQNFSMDDLLGVTADGGRRGGVRRPTGGGGRPSGGGPDGGGGGGNNVSDFLVSGKDGVSTTKSFGTNYADKWGTSADVSGSYFFNRTDNNSASSLTRDYYSTGINQFYSEDNTSSSLNINHRANFKIEYKIDTLNAITFIPKYTYQKNDGNSFINGITTQSGIDLNNINSSYLSNQSANNGSFQLLLRHKFETKGRTISLGLNGALSNSQGDNSLYSFTGYKNYPASNSLTDQIASFNNTGKSVSTNLVYTEPINDYNFLMINANVGYGRDQKDKKTYTIDSVTGDYINLSSSLSNVFLKDVFNQAYGFGWRYNYQQVNINASLNYSINEMKSDESYPVNYNLYRRFYSWQPNLNMRFTFSKDQNLHVNYRLSNNSPSIDQLQEVVDNSSSTKYSIGNSSLSQDYRHNIGLRYSLINFGDMNSMFLMLNSVFAQNYIGYSTNVAAADTIVGGVTVPKGVQIQKPTNLDGYVSIRSMLNYSLPVRFISMNLNTNVAYTYTKTPGVVNGISKFSESNTYSAGLFTGSSLSDKLDFSLMANTNYTVIANGTSSSANSNYFTHRVRAKVYWNFWMSTIIQTDFEYKFDGSATSSTTNPNSYVWNAYIGKKFLAGDKAELRFSVYDILNKNSNIQRTITDTYIEDSKTNVLGRYYMLTFIYTIRAFS